MTPNIWHTLKFIKNLKYDFLFKGDSRTMSWSLTNLFSLDDKQKKYFSNTKQYKDNKLLHPKQSASHVITACESSVYCVCLKNGIASNGIDTLGNFHCGQSKNVCKICDALIRMYESG